MLSGPPCPRQRPVKSRRCNRFNNPHHKTWFLLEFTSRVGPLRSHRAAGELLHVPEPMPSRNSRQRNGLHGRFRDRRDDGGEPGPDRAPVSSLAQEHVHPACRFPHCRANLRAWTNTHIRSRPRPFARDLTCGRASCLTSVVRRCVRARSSARIATAAPRCARAPTRRACGRSTAAASRPDTGSTPLVRAFSVVAVAVSAAVNRDRNHAAMRRRAGPPAKRAVAVAIFAEPRGGGLTMPREFAARMTRLQVEVARHRAPDALPIRIRRRA